jgi:hypothetical protein
MDSWNEGFRHNKNHHLDPYYYPNFVTMILSLRQSLHDLWVRIPPTNGGMHPTRMNQDNDRRRFKYLRSESTFVTQLMTSAVSSAMTRIRQQHEQQQQQPPPRFANETITTVHEDIRSKPSGTFFRTLIRHMLRRQNGHYVEWSRRLLLSTL